MATLLALMNRLLTRTGQNTLTTLAGLTSPATQALEALNDTYAELLQTLPIHSLVRQGSVGLVPGIAGYDLAPTVRLEALLPASLRLANTTQPLTEVALADTTAYDTTQQGTPTHFWKLGDQLRLWPTPNATITLNYLHTLRAQPLGSTPPISADDAINVNVAPDWERVILLGAQSLLERYLGDANANQTYALYNNALQQLKARARHRQRTALQSAYRRRRPNH
jgi:hypothetical protein